MFGFKLFRVAEVEKIQKDLLVKDILMEGLCTKNGRLEGQLSELRRSSKVFEDVTEKIFEGQMSDPEKLGFAFAKATDKEQADFLNAVGEVFASWGYSNSDLQCAYIFDHLNEHGKKLIEMWYGWAQYREEVPAPVEDQRDPVCVCGVHRSEHTLCGCADGFEERIQIEPIKEAEEYDPFGDDTDNQICEGRR